MNQSDIMTAYLEWLDQAAFFARDGGRSPDVLAAEWVQNATAEQKRFIGINLTYMSLFHHTLFLDHADQRSHDLLNEMAEKIADLSASQWEEAPDTPLLVAIAGDIRESVTALGSVKRLRPVGG